MGHIVRSENCVGCGLPIRGSYVTVDGQNWHPHCAKCSICGLPLSVNVIADYWGGMYCLRHGSEYQRCFSCGRLISKLSTGGGKLYKDGRAICYICHKTAVRTEEDTQQVFKEIDNFLSSNDMNLIRNRIAIKIVSKNQLIQLGRKDHMEGITQAEFLIVGNKGQLPTSFKLFILGGLPRIHFGSILTHELFHVILITKGLSSLEAFVQEGICQLGAYYWLSSLKSSEGNYYLDRISKNEDPIYGDGFRAALQSVNKMGSLEQLFYYLRDFKQFP